MQNSTQQITKSIEVSQIPKPKCCNCKYAGQQFKVGSLTHLHCEHPKYKEEDFLSGKLSPWDTLEVFSNTCTDHEFKNIYTMKAQPQTSLLAFSNFQDKKQKDHEAILGCLAVNSDLTYRQIAKDLRWHYDPVKVARRMSELVLAGKVEITGTKICPIAKSLCSVYKLKTIK